MKSEKNIKRMSILVVTLMLSITTWFVCQKPQVHAEPNKEMLTSDLEKTNIDQEKGLEETIQINHQENITTQSKEFKVEKEEPKNITPEKRTTYEWETERYGDFETEYILDESLDEDEEIYEQEGHLGQVSVEYILIFEDDILISKEKTGNESIMSEPQNEIIRYGQAKIVGNYNRDFAIEVFNFTNLYRQSKNLAPLIWDESLYQSAQIRAKEISELFSHTRPNGSSWDSVNEDVMGENLAYGFKTAESIVKAWQKSPSHQENLVRDFSHMVIAAYTDENGQLYISQLFSYR